MKLFSIVLVLTLLAGTVAAQDPPPPVGQPSAGQDSAKVWKEFNSKEGRFSVSVPGTPKPEDRTMETPIGSLTTYAFVLQTDMALYYVSYVDLPMPPGPLTPEDRKEALDSTRERILGSGARIITESDVSVAGNPGTEILAEKDAMILRARFALIGSRLYQIILGAPRTSVFINGKVSPKAADRTHVFEQTSAKFFDSFKPIN
jgi:hypothetical protein